MGISRCDVDYRENTFTVFRDSGQISTYRITEDYIFLDTILDNRDAIEVNKVVIDESRETYTYYSYDSYEGYK